MTNARLEQDLKWTNNTEIVCSWCAKSKTTGEQLSRESDRYKHASHGICADCSSKMVVPKTFIRKG